MQIQDFKDNYITGRINVKTDENLLYFSVPYDEGWDIKIDGVDVEPVEVAESMMAVPIESGEHNIEMHYRSKGLNQGLAISGISILFFIFMNVILLVRKNKNYR